MHDIKEAANDLMSAAVAGRITGMAFVYIDSGGEVRTEVFEGDDPCAILCALGDMTATIYKRITEEEDEDAPDSEPAETEGERTGEDL